MARSWRRSARATASGIAARAASGAARGMTSVRGADGGGRWTWARRCAAVPLPTDVATSPGSLGGIPVVNVDVSGVDPRMVILYLHGGAYAIGSATSSVGLASDLTRRAGARLVSVDYRLAPENPHPAAIEDAVAAWRAIRWTGGSVPWFADLAGLPPLLLQSGSHEILLNDATRLAARAAAADVAVKLEITPVCPTCSRRSHRCSTKATPPSPAPPTSCARTSPPSCRPSQKARGGRRYARSASCLFAATTQAASPHPSA